MDSGGWENVSKCLNCGGVVTPEYDYVPYRNMILNNDYKL